MSDEKSSSSSSSKKHHHKDKDKQHSRKKKKHSDDEDYVQDVQDGDDEDDSLVKKPKKTDVVPIFVKKEEITGTNFMDLLKTPKPDNNNHDVPIAVPPAPIPVPLKPKTFHLFVCNTHKTINPWRAATIIVCENKDNAFRLLDEYLLQKGFPTYKDSSYEIIQLDPHVEQIVMLTTEELEQKKLLLDTSDVHIKKTFVCNDHDMFVPKGSATVVVADDLNRATTLLNGSLKKMGLKIGSFSLQEINMNRQQVQMLYDGSMRAYT